MIFLAKNKETLKEDERLNKSMVFNTFLEEYPDFKKFNLSQKRFWMWIEKYCSFNNIELIKGQDTMGQRYIELIALK